MIPKIIHSCWFGKGTKPELVERCITSWHACMPCVSDSESQWTYMEWSEVNFDIATAPLYVQQAYAAEKYAFVSDYVRLWALEQYGGVYFDTDVQVIRSFNELQEFTMHNAQCTSFIGFEESKAKTLGTNVIGAEPHCTWIQEMLQYYEKTPFIKGERLKDGAERLRFIGEEYDMTPNSELIARLLEKYGLVRNGKEQFLPLTCSEASSNLSPKIHIYDYHHFSPITSTRVMRKTKDTFSIHHCYGSWTEGSKGNRIRNSVIVREIANALIQIKRLFEK